MLKFKRSQVLAGLALVALGSLVAVSTQAHARIIKSTGKAPAAWTAEQNRLKAQRMNQQIDAIQKSQDNASAGVQDARQHKNNVSRAASSYLDSQRRIKASQ